MQRSVSKSNLLILIFFIVAYASVSICEPIKNIQIFYAMALVLLSINVIGNKSHVAFITILMMLLPIVFSDYKNFDLSKILKYESYMLTFLMVSKIKRIPVSLPLICGATCYVHVIITIFLFIFPSIYSIFWIVWGTNVYEHFPMGTESGTIGFRAGVTSHYSANALYIVMAFMSIWSLYVSINEGIKKRIYLLFLFLAAFTLLLTTKRGHLIFGILSIFIVCFYIYRKKIISYVVKLLNYFIVLCILLFVTYNFYPDFIGLFDRFQDASDSGRFNLWEKAFMFWTEKPLFGIGWGCFQEKYLKYDFVSYNVHNTYIQILCETGIIGFMVYIFFLLNNMAKMLFCLKRIKCFCPECRLLIKFNTAIQFFFLLYSLTGNCLYDNTLFYYAISAGVTVSLYNNFKKNEICIK